jgi:hypothetical protein
MKNLICGVGENDVPGFSKHPLYRVWTGMLWSCYGPNAKHPAIGGRHVCLSWLGLSQFVRWAWPNRWRENLYLCVNLIEPGCREYNPETCCFVTRDIWLAIQSGSGPFPRGVSWDAERQQFVAMIHESPTGSESVLDAVNWVPRLDGLWSHTLGYFDTIQDAEVAYLEAKAAYLRRLARKEMNVGIWEGLHHHARLAESRI